MSNDRQSNYCAATAQPPCSIDRQRTCAANERAKVQRRCFCRIEVRPTERDKLIQLALLNKARRNDKIAVRDAIYAFLERHLDPPPAWPLGDLAQQWWLREIVDT
jgi:hypothetical protein